MTFVMIVLGLAVVGLAGLVLGMTGPPKKSFPKPVNPHGDARQASEEETREAMRGAGGRTLDLDERMF
jgi:hypothetical protein